MRFRAQGAQRHTRRIKARQDSLQRLYLVHFDWAHVGLQGQQITDRGYRPVLSQGGVFTVSLKVTGLNRLVQCSDHIRIKGVVFTTVYKLQQATLLNGFTSFPGIHCQALGIGFEISKAGTLDTALHAAEATVHHITGNTHRFEQLRSPIGGNGGNPHFGQNFQQALIDGFAEILLGVDGIHQYFPGTHQVTDHIKSQIRVYRGRTKADEAGKMMRITGRCGFHHDIAFTAQGVIGEVVMHGTGGHQGRDG